MKFIYITILSLVGLVSCVNPTTGKVSAVTTAQNAQPYARPGADAIGIGLLAVAPNPVEKVKRAKWLFAVATAIRSISSTTPPSVADFQKALTTITPTNENDWLQVVTALSGLYSGFRAQFGNNTNTVLLLIEQIALGLEDAADPYVTTT